MATIGDTTRPAFAYDSATDTWIPVGVGPHAHTPAAIGAISNSLTTTTGDLIYAASANTPARLGIGSTGNVLTVSGGVPVWSAPAGGGKVLQVVQGTTSTENTTTSSSFSDTGLTATITPSATSSKILAFVMQNGSTKEVNNSITVRLLRGATNILETQQFTFYTATSMVFFGIVNMSYLDSPSSTSALTYKTQFASPQGSAVQVNKNGSATSLSTLVLMEIGA